MKEISLADLKKLTLKEIHEGPCLRVTGNGVMVFYAIIEPQGAMRTRVEGIASQIDASKGV